MNRKWTFMVYMAGDNGKVFDDNKRLFYDLQLEGWSDLAEMASVGSTDDVAIVAQYDTLAERQFTQRFYLASSSPNGQLVEKIPPVNTGDPANLTDFIVWATQNYPAEKYALVLWNHGSGWNEDDIYARYRDLEQIRKRDLARSFHPSLNLLKRTVFLPTAAEIMGIEDDDVRGICYDDSSLDFLDNQDLAKALTDAAQQTGQRLSILGMDACLMSMIEVAYQVRDCADFLVGSQELEPGDGWPYKDILRTLVTRPAMLAIDLCQNIVEQMGAYYLRTSRNGGSFVTQSAIDLHVIPETFEKVTRLAKSITNVYSTDFKTELAMGRAQKRVRRFSQQGKDYADLQHFAELLRDEYTGTLDVGILAGDLAQHLATVVSHSPIVANFHGRSLPNASGLSIYFPDREYSPFYDRQDFALSGWPEVIRCANHVQPPAISALQDQAEDVLKKGGSIGALLITCPICGAQLELPSNLEGVSVTIATKGIRDTLAQMADILRKAFASPTTEANVWIDLPCPNCRHTFQYNFRAGESRK